jgi:hypothetical protein
LQSSHSDGKNKKDRRGGTENFDSQLPAATNKPPLALSTTHPNGRNKQSFFIYTTTEKGVNKKIKGM